METATAFSPVATLQKGFREVEVAEILQKGVDWDRKQRLVIPAGAVYADQDLYYFYDIDKAGNTAGAIRLAKEIEARRHMDIKIGPFPFARDFQ